MSIDPVTLVVIQSALQHIASEMDLVHEKASFSPIISESLDRANGIYHRLTGEVIAQGQTSLPTFVGVMQFTTQSVIDHRRDLEDGDVVVVNDPYFGGTHLMDVKLVKPFYYAGNLVLLDQFRSLARHRRHGSRRLSDRRHRNSAEGLRLPPVKLYRKGELCQDVLDIILSNIRVPDERIGDIKAQVGALAAGERELTRLLDRYGADFVDAAVAELRSRSEILMRRCIETATRRKIQFFQQHRQ